MRRWLPAVLAFVAATSACSSSSNSTSTSHVGATSTVAPRSAAVTLLPLHATTGANPGVFDSEGRQVLLRGVNVNSLGDYYQDDPALPTVVPVTNQDWAAMAAHGFDVVRLLVSWSRLEPRHGIWDNQYIATLQRTVDTAARYGIYSVIDMHQDAWGKYIASPKGVHCTAGGTPAIGWDGAPKWATFTNGADTCAHGSREMSQAVETAWDSFYANRKGIMDALTETWGVLARQFADDPAVAGYDLLNEPNHGHNSVTALRALAGYYGNTIRVIRNREQALALSNHAAFHHIVFFEDTVFGSVVAPGFTNDTNIVFAPHNYGESIGNIPIEAEFDYYAGLLPREKGNSRADSWQCWMV